MKKQSSKYQAVPSKAPVTGQIVTKPTRLDPTKKQYTVSQGTNSKVTRKPTLTPGQPISTRKPEPRGPNGVLAPGNASEDSASKWYAENGMYRRGSDVAASGVIDSQHRTPAAQAPAAYYVPDSKSMQRSSAGNVGATPTVANTNPNSPSQKNPMGTQ